MNIKELEGKIKDCNKRYYDGEEPISDLEYDKLIAELRALDPHNALLDTVIDEVNDIEGFEKRKLPITMGTLKKCQNEKQIFEEFRKRGNSNYILEHKIDGNGQLLCCDDGNLEDVISRGNAKDGFVMTDNFKKIPYRNKTDTIVLPNGENFDGHIRGEVYMSNEIFEKKYSKLMKNPRAAAAGIMKRLDGNGCEDLSFIAYDVFNDYFADKTEKEKLLFLKDNGFAIPAFKEVSSPEEMIEWRKEVATLRDKLPYPIDGIVAKSQEVDYEDLMRVTPMKNFAIKFDLDYAISKIIDIEWSFKGSMLSPVAIIEPVELCGTTVSRASLHNVNIMEELGVEIGKLAMITKRGEIIPKVEKCLEQKDL